MPWQSVANIIGVGDDDGDDRDLSKLGGFIATDFYLRDIDVTLLLADVCIAPVHGIKTHNIVDGHALVTDRHP